MITVSDEWRSYFYKYRSHLLTRGILTLASGIEYLLDYEDGDDDFISMAFADATSSESSFDVGNFILNTCTFKLNNSDRKWKNILMENAKLEPYVGFQHPRLNYALMSGNYDTDTDTGAWSASATAFGNYYIITAYDGYVRLYCKTATSTAYYAYLTLTDDFDSSEEAYTVTFKVRASASKAINVYARRENSNGTISNVQIGTISASNVTANTWTTYSITFTPDEDYTYTGIGFSMGTFNTAGNYLDVEYVMVEQGEEYTEWYRAREDFTENGVEWVKKGTFYITDTGKRGSRISLTAYDNTNAFETSFSEIDITYPITVGNFVQTICNYVGVPLATTTFPNSTYVITTEPNTSSTDYTCREMVSYAAMLAGCYARCNVDGELEFKWYDSTENIHSIPMYSSLDNNERDTEITGVKVVAMASENVDSSTDVSTESTSDEYTYGSEDDYLITIQNNPLIPYGNAEETATLIGGQVVGTTFRSTEIKTLYDPSMEAGDTITAENEDGGIITFYAANISVSIGSYATVKCSSLEEYSGTGTSVINYIMGQTADLVNAKFYNFITKNLAAEVANIGFLYADSAVITELSADIANITAILSGSIGTGTLQAVHLTADNTVIDEAVITSAMIASIVANKITSGTLYTSLVTIQSAEGDRSLYITDSLIAMYDSNNTQRLQAGESSEEEGYNFVIWDKNGTEIFNATGVTASGIPSETIVNDHVANNAAISGSKLDIQSVASALSDDGTLTIEYSKVIVDDTTLDYALATITSNADAAQAAAGEAQATADAAQAAADDAKAAADAAAEDAVTAQETADNASSEALAAQVAADEAQATADAAQEAADAAQEAADAAAETAASAQSYSEAVQQEAATALSEYAQSVSKTLSSLQDQVDGAIETWYYDYEPTLQNLPASDWTTNEEKDTHIGDLFFDTSTGYSYRFYYAESSSSYIWALIQDSAITAALAVASAAQDTADEKRRVFITTPTPPYDVGDLWADGVDIKTCTYARESGSTYVSSDWIVLNEYANQSTVDAAQEAADAAQAVADAAQAAADAAQADADAAQSTAVEAADSAGAAQAAANAAQATAEEAATNATAAQEAADAAQAAADAIEERTTTLETDLSVVQGKIDLIVSETDITELQNGDTTLYDLYANINVSVGEITGTVSELTTQVTDNYSNLNDKITQVSETADGISSTVSELSTTVTNNYTSLEEKITTVSETTDGLSATVSSLKTVVENLITDGTFEGYTTFGASYSWYRSNQTYITVSTYNDKDCVCFTRGGSSYYLRQAISLPAGTYVIKAKIACDSNYAPAVYVRLGSEYVYMHAEGALTSDWVTYSTSITIESASTYFYLYCHAAYGSTSTASTILYVTDIAMYESVESELVSASLALEIKEDSDGNSYGALSANADYIYFQTGDFIVDADNFQLTEDSVSLYGTVYLNNSLYMYVDAADVDAGYYRIVKIVEGENHTLIYFGMLEDDAFINDTYLLLSSGGGYRLRAGGNDVFYYDTGCFCFAQSLGDAPKLSGYGTAVFGTSTDHAYMIRWENSTPSLSIIVDSTAMSLSYTQSDERLKKNFGEIDDALVEAVGNTPLLTYNMDCGIYDDSIEYVGTTAQKLIEQLELQGLSVDDARKLIGQQQTFTDDETLYYMIDYEQFLLLRTIYDEKRIAALEAKIALMEERLAALEGGSN